jgi:hypothetical protein
MKTNFDASESDKKEILDLHNRIKESLNYKRAKININEQSSQLNGVALLNAAKVNDKCLLTFGGILKSAPGKPIVLFKIADYDSKNGYFVKGDELWIKDDFTFDVMKNVNGVKKLSSQNKQWKCNALYQKETDAKKAEQLKKTEDKTAEELKKTQTQQGLTKQQQEYKTGLEGQGYVIDPSSWDIQNKELKQINPSSIPGFRVDIFPNGLNVWADQTKLKDFDIDSFIEREKNKTPNVDKCKDFVQTYWDSYKNSDADNKAMDTDTLKTKNIVQACANHWYPKWDGLKGGFLGIANGQNHLDNIIDVLTGVKDSYEQVRTPSMSTGWGLRKPKTQR